MPGQPYQICGRCSRPGYVIERFLQKYPNPSALRVIYTLSVNFAGANRAAITLCARGAHLTFRISLCSTASAQARFGERGRGGGASELCVCVCVMTRSASAPVAVQACVNASTESSRTHAFLSRFCNDAGRGVGDKIKLSYPGRQ